jgi:Skp family chaperone for outer membrane proteins
MRLMSTVCAVAVAASAIAATPDAFAQRRGNNQAASVIVVNYQRVLSESSLGRDLAAKLNQIRTQIGGEAQALAPEAQSIEQEAERLRRSLANQSQQQLAANPQVQALAQRQNTLQQRTATQQGDFECTQLIALRDARSQVMPIVRAIMQQRNAGLVIDSSQALEVTGDYDITTTVIQQLDQNAATRTANVARHPVAECQPQQAQQQPSGQ